MFRNEISIEYREAAVDAVLRGGRGIGVVRPEAEAEALQRRLAAERAVDSVLADSFPASDPPSWTLGIAHPQPARLATNAEAVAPDAGRAARTFLNGLVSLAGASGIALLVPFVILVIGMPVALAVRGVAEAAGWLLALIFS